MSAQPPPGPVSRRAKGKVSIDIRVHSARQLFDGRDPAPFRERGLDENAVDYVLDSARDAPPGSEFELVVWLTDVVQPINDGTIVQAIQGHFDYLLARVARNMQRHVRLGQIKFVVGLVVLATFLSLARLCEILPDSTARRVVQEGLSIVAWVAMWRPLEVLLYDWWPLMSDRSVLRRIRAAEIRIVHQSSGSVLPKVESASG